jgi:hypothetical protein
MGVLTPQAINVAGATPTYTSVSASDTVDISALNDRVWLHVKNTHSSSDTTTVVDAGVSPAGNSGVDPTYTVAATTGDREIRLRSAAASAGIITITHSNTNALVVQGVFYLAD